MASDKQRGSLSEAIDHQSAEWLEANVPEIFDALERELQAGRSLNDIRRILRRKFGNDLREPFVVRVLQAAEYLRGEIITPTM
jgi:hypothetical protein